MSGSHPASPAPADGADGYALDSSQTDVRRAWGVTALVIALMVGVFFLFWPTATSLMEQWGETRNLTYTHGYLIVALCVWLIARKREQLSRESITPNPMAAAALFLTTIVWLIAVRAGIQIIHQLLLPILIWLTICAALGYAVARRVTFAVLYLVFAIPVWDYINFILQGVSVAAVDLMLKVTGVTAFVEGNIIHIPAGTFEIAGGCSGLHFFIVGFAIAALYGEVGNDSLKARLQILTVGVGLSLMSNWIRIYIIILAGALTDMQHYLVRVEHYKFGWAMFAVVMVVFFTIVRRIPASLPSETAPRREPASDNSFSKQIVGAVLACVALVGVPLLKLIAPASASSLPASLLPQHLGSWTGPLSPSIAWNPVFKGVDVEQRGEYRTIGGGDVQMYVAAFRSQSQEKELVSYGNSLVGPNEGAVVSETRIESPAPMIEAIVQQESGQAVVWYFYEIGDKRTNRSIAAQLWYGIGSLTAAPLAKAVAMRAPCVPDCVAAREVLSGFVAASGGQALH